MASFRDRGGAAASAPDLSALREKYAQLPPATGVSTETPSSTAPSKLDSMTICRGCGGCGTVKAVYNHVASERDCARCDGEGVVQTAPAK